MPLISETGLLADSWHPVAEDQALPASAQALLPLARLLKESEALANRNAPLGVAVPGDTSLSVLETWLPRLGLIAVLFPVFSDGRGFSLARQLRLAGYERELRAAGPLIADQFAFALACGFDTIEIDDQLAQRQPIEQWLAALEAMSVTYQRSYDGPLNALEARRRSRRMTRRAAGGGL